MFRLDTHTHKLMAQDRIDSLNRSRRIDAQPTADEASVDRNRRGGVSPAPPLFLPAVRKIAAPLRSIRA